MADEYVPRMHEDKDLFRAALIFTERDTGFGARLVAQSNRRHPTFPAALLPPHLATSIRRERSI